MSLFHLNWNWVRSLFSPTKIVVHLAKKVCTWKPKLKFAFINNTTKNNGGFGLDELDRHLCSINISGTSFVSHGAYTTDAVAGLTHYETQLTIKVGKSQTFQKNHVNTSKKWFCMIPGELFAEKNNFANEQHQMLHSLNVWIYKLIH